MRQKYILSKSLVNNDFQVGDILFCLSSDIYFDFKQLSNIGYLFANNGFIHLIIVYNNYIYLIYYIIYIGKVELNANINTNQSITETEEHMNSLISQTYGRCVYTNDTFMSRHTYASTYVCICC